MLKGTRLLLASFWIVGLASTAAFAARPLGIDTSEYCPLTQSEWNAIYSSGRVFGWTRASYGDCCTDDELANHMTRATNAGLLMGVYHYSYPGLESSNTPTNEANTFLNAAGSYMTTGYLLPVLDVEEAAGSYMGGLTLSEWVIDFLDYMEQETGVRPIVYSGQYFASVNLDSSVTSWPYWMAAWNAYLDPLTDSPGYTTPWSTWAFWQYLGDVTIPDVTDQQVDLNVFNGTLAQLEDNYVIAASVPAITQHPSSQTCGIGSTVVLTVVSSGRNPLTYQWQKDSSNMSNGGHYSGCTTATLTITTADTNDDADYRCKVSNTDGSATSNVAALTVSDCTPPSITNASFEGGNTGGVANGWTSYQRATNPSSSWSIQTASPPTGAGTQYQQIANTSATGGGGIRQAITGCTSGVIYTITGWMRTNSASATAQVRVSPTASTDWSTAIDLSPAQSTTSSTWVAFSGTVTATGTSMTIWLDGHTGGSGQNKTSCFDAVAIYGCPAAAGPTITQQPSAQSICSGSNASFSVAATGSGTLYYQWQKDSSNISNGGHYSGCTTATLAITGADTNDNKDYRCVVTDSVGSTNSNQAALSFKTATSITTHPSNQSVATGGNASFSVVAGGDGTLTYQWQKTQTNISNGGHYSGCTTATLSISSADTNDQANYRCIVTGTCGSATSNEASLTVSSCGTPSLANGNFETGTAANPPSGWTTYVQSSKTGSWSIQTASPPQGTQWQQTQVLNTGAYGGVRQNVTGLTSGSIYTISGSYKTNSASATASVRYNLSGNTDRANSTSLVSKYATSWGTFSADVTASGSSLMLFLDHLNGSSSSKASAFDNIKVVCKP